MNFLEIIISMRVGLELVLFTRKSTRPDLLAFSKCLLNKLVTICLILSAQGKSLCETFTISVGSMHPKQNLLLTAHAGVEKHWLRVKRSGLESHWLCAVLAKVYRQVRNIQKYVPSGGRATRKPSQSEYKHHEPRSNDYYSEGVSSNMPYKGSFYFIIFHFISSFITF